MGKNKDHVFKDEDGVIVRINTNMRDGNDYEERLSKSNRPILLQIESELFTSYKFVNYAFTLQEAKELVTVMQKIIKHVEGE